MTALFGTLPVFVDTSIPTNEIIVVDNNKRGTPIVWKHADPATDEERQVLEVANRLLDRTGPALALDMMQRAIDTVHERTGRTPASIIMHPSVRSIIMHPSVRREYVELLNADRRYHDPFYTSSDT
jgi:hypothetical protein